MAQYSFVARDKAGIQQRGSLEALSPNEALANLRQRGWMVLDVRQAAEQQSSNNILALLNPGNYLSPGLSHIELSLRQIALMIRGGLTLLTALQTTAKQTTRRSMRLVWERVAAQIQEGMSLADAMSQHRCFSEYILQLARVGEQTGQLAPVITRAAKSLESRRRMFFNIVNALIYPSIVVVAAIGVTIFMVFHVIPHMVVFLEAIGKELPYITQLLIDVTNFVRAYIVHGLILATSIALAFWAVYSNPQGRLWIDRIFLRIPMVGNVLRLAGTASFARTLGTLIHSGITLLEALQTVERLQSNRQLAQTVGEARQAILQGGNLADPLTRRNSFTPMLAQMVAIGEASGTLEEVLEELADFHEEQLQNAIRQLSILVEPLITIVIGGIVGFVYLAFFVALFAAGGAG